MLTVWVIACGGAVQPSTSADSGSTVVELAVGQIGANEIVVDEAFAYWSTAGSADGGFMDGTIMETRLDGGPAIVLASNQRHPYGLAVDRERVYWSDTGTGAADGTISSMPLHGGSSTTLAVGQGNPADLGVDATSLLVRYTLAGDAGRGLRSVR